MKMLFVKLQVMGLDDGGYVHKMETKGYYLYVTYGDGNTKVYNVEEIEKINLEVRNY